MLTLNATVLNVFQTPEGKNKEGNTYGGDYKVQLQGHNVLKNGEKRIDLLTLSTTEPEKFRGFAGDVVSVPVGAFVYGKSITYYITDHSQIRPVTESKSSSKGITI